MAAKFSFMPGRRRRSLLLLDLPLEEAATPGLVHNFDAFAVDGRVGAVGSVAVVVNPAATGKVDVRRSSHHLNGWVPVLVGKPWPEAVDAAGLGL